MVRMKGSRRHVGFHEKDDTFCGSLDPIGLGFADPRNDKARLIEISGGLSKSQYGWILESTEFQSWRGERKKRILWLKGEAGNGKTTQVCGIIDELEKDINNPHFLSFFFCHGTDSRNNTAIAILRGLVYILVQQQPLLLKYTRATLKQLAKGSNKDAVAWESLSIVFTELLGHPLIRRRGACFIIDGLDACTDLQTMLALIAKAALYPHVKWFISCRSSSDIEQYPVGSSQETAIHLDPPPQVIPATISAIIRDRMSRITLSEADYAEVVTLVENHLENANGKFLWTILVLRALENGLECNRLLELRAYPPDVESLYVQSAERIKDSAHGHICLRLLALATITQRPLNTREASLLLEIQDDTTDDQISLVEVVRQAAVFLIIHHETIHFVHSSAKAFLLSTLRGSNNMFADILSSMDNNIVSRSLDMMSTILRRDIYKLQRPGITIDQVKQPQPDPLAAIQYSITGWIDHLGDSYRNDTNSFNECLHRFLQENYLHWLEALSLLQRVPEGVRAFKKLQDLYGQPSPLGDLIRDAYEFLITNRIVIEYAPLQVYVSALVFSSPTSLVRELYRKEEPSWIIQNTSVSMAGVPKSPDHNRHSGPVWSVAFSPTDRQVAASASDDQTIKIWNTATATCVRTLRGHTDWIWSINFSPDGQKIGSTSDDNTVKIWHVATGGCLRTIDGHGEGSCSKSLTFGVTKRFTIWSIAFSHNGEQIAAGTQDHTVEIWDTVTGRSLRTLSGHTRSVYTVAFWGNSLVASGSGDGTVKLWDIKSGKCLLTIDNIAVVYTVVFSHDGKQVASAGREVKTWDATTGTLIHTYKSEKATGVAAVAYSHDDTLIATVSENTVINIWTSSTAKHLRKLEGHENSIYSVVFPFHNRFIASSSSDGIVKLWSVSTGECIRTLLHGGREIWGLAFARGDQEIVSGSDRGTVKIWSVEAGTCLQEFKAHDKDLNYATMSHNGQQIATAAHDGKIKLWDVVYGSSAWLVTFSKDDKSVATCSDIGTVRIWEQATGKCSLVIQSGDSPVYSICFSPGSQYLAVAADNHLVSIFSNHALRSLRARRRLRGHTGPVWAVAWPSESRIISASNDRTLRVWDHEAYTCIRVIDVGTSLSSLHVDESYIYTETGLIELQNAEDSSSGKAEDAGSEKIIAADSNDLIVPASKDASRQHNYGLSSNRCWITDNGENVMFLPPTMKVLSSAVSRQAICIGCGTGQVIFLNFSSYE